MTSAALGERAIVAVQLRDPHPRSDVTDLYSIEHRESDVPWSDGRSCSRAQRAISSAHGSAAVAVLLVAIALVQEAMIVRLSS